MKTIIITAFCIISALSFSVAQISEDEPDSFQETAILDSTLTDTVSPIGVSDSCRAEAEKPAPLSESQDSASGEKALQMIDISRTQTAARISSSCPTCTAPSLSSESSVQDFLVPENYLLPEQKGMLLASGNLLFFKQGMNRAGDFALWCGNSKRKFIIIPFAPTDRMMDSLIYEMQASYDIDSVYYLSGG